MLDIAIVAGVSEVWIRFLIPVKNVCYYHDPQLGDMFCPEQKTYGYVEPGYSNLLLNNSLGFHDIERSIKKKSGQTRIQVYGDSLTAALGVPIDKTIPSLLESFLNEGRNDSTVEVMNMASAEDSTAAQFLTYQLIGAKFDPDIVICYFMSDFHDNIIETHKRTRSPYYGLNEDNSLYFIPPVPVDTEKPLEKFKRASMLYRLLANKFLESKIYHNATSFMEQSFSRFKQGSNKDKKEKKGFDQRRQEIMREKAWPVTTALLKAFHEKAAQDGAVFVLVDGRIIKNEFGGAYKNDDLKKFCNGIGIKYISLYEKYEKMRKGPHKAEYFLDDGHPTIRGNEELSRILSTKFRQVLMQLQNKGS